MSDADCGSFSMTSNKLTLLSFANISSILGSALNSVKLDCSIKLGNFLSDSTTLTVYSLFEPLGDSTLYVTGTVKSLGVLPLSCTVFATFTRLPVVLNDATNPLRSVPFGTVTTISSWEMFPITGVYNPLKEKATNSLRGLPPT